MKTMNKLMIPASSSFAPESSVMNSSARIDSVNVSRVASKMMLEVVFAARTKLKIPIMIIIGRSSGSQIFK